MLFKMLDYNPPHDGSFVQGSTTVAMSKRISEQLITVCVVSEQDKLMAVLVYTPSELKKVAIAINAILEKVQEVTTGVFYA